MLTFTMLYLIHFYKKITLYHASNDFIIMRLAMLFSLFQSGTARLDIFPDNKNSLKAASLDWSPLSYLSDNKHNACFD